MSAPIIVSVSPASAAIGDTVTLTGTSFGSSQGTSTITVDGQPVTPSSWGDTSIAFKVPDTAAVHKYANAKAPTVNEVAVTVGTDTSKLEYVVTG